MDIREKISHSLIKVKEKRPLIHHITNYVTANDCANAVLAIGGSPVMADAPIEVGEMVKHANSLVLNLGTCNEEKIMAMKIAGKIANEKNIPVILDPVGIGATDFRYKSTLNLLKEVKIHGIRGNMSEIKLLAGLKTKAYGVDSIDEDQQGAKIAYDLAKSLGSIIAITGKTDVVSDGHDTFLLDNGHIHLTKITGTGCMTSSLISCYMGANTDLLVAMIAGISTMGIAGEMAASRMQVLDGPGSFKVYLMDAIHQITSKNLIKEAKIQYAKINE